MSSPHIRVTRYGAGDYFTIETPSRHVCEPLPPVQARVQGCGGFRFPASHCTKGRSLMVSSTSSVPWYNTPARPFPAKAWLQGRYWFTLPRLTATPSPAPTATLQPAQRRPFPAKDWLAGLAPARAAGGGQADGTPLPPNAGWRGVGGMARPANVPVQKTFGERGS